ncbi:MAG: MIP family channel protein [Bacteroidota bacterium]
MSDAPKAYFAEFLGTALLLFCGTGAIVVDVASGGTVGHLGIAFSFGAIVTAVIYSFGEVSGAHINPAVTLAFWLAGKFPGRRVPGYLLAQSAGALLASAALRFIFPETPTLGETLPAGPPLQSFVLEIVLTFILMLVILQVATGSREQGLTAGVVIGLVVMLEAAFAGPICGASMNPARSLAPALVNANLTHLWIYLVAPVIGAALAVGPWKLLQGPK